MKNIKGLDFLEKLVKHLNAEQKYLDSLNGRKIDLSQEKTFSVGPFLHETSENASEKESAKFELENKQTFDWLQSLKEEIFRHLRPLE